MDPYRLYILNPISGRVDQSRHFLAKDDETAVWISEGIRHARPMELWHGRCKVHQWGTMTETAPLPELEVGEDLIPARPMAVH